jgi:hypothetical protein
VTFWILAFAVVAAVWWWLSRMPVTKQRVPEVSARIEFPAPLRLDSPTEAIALLNRPDEIVIPHQYAILVLEFPLTVPARLAITAPIQHGFTRASLVRTICEEYEAVYEIEEGTAQTKTLPKELRDGLGRNRTDGTFGIWGHDLSELVVTAVHWTRTPDNRVTIKPHVESRATASLPS